MTALDVESNQVQLQLFEKVLEQCHKTDHLEAEEFAWLCLYLLGDTDN